MARVSGGAQLRPRKVVLLVDGDAERLGMRRLLLENQAHVRVVPCGSAEDMLVMLKAGLRVDLMITQWRLPGLSGNDLCALAAQVDPMMNRLLLDEGRDCVPDSSWAHRWLGSKASIRDLLDAVRVLVQRKRGPTTGAAVRAARDRETA